MATPSWSSSSNSENEDYSEQLDPLSPMFDARRALYSKSVKIPFPDARQFNNVAEFENFLKGRDAASQKKSNLDSKKEKQKHPGIVAERAAAQAREAVRKAALLVKNEGPSERSQTQIRRARATTVFTRMEDFIGPLSVLRRCVEEKIKVLVVIRAAVSVRSHCKGYVIAFDKHFNMALMDVDETYIRSSKKHSDNSVASTEASDEQDQALPSETEDRLVKPHSSRNEQYAEKLPHKSRSEHPAASRTESVVMDKLSEIFQQCSENTDLSERCSKQCNISNVKDGAKSAVQYKIDTIVGTRSVTTSKTKSDVHVLTMPTQTSKSESCIRTNLEQGDNEMQKSCDRSKNNDVNTTLNAGAKVAMNLRAKTRQGSNRQGSNTETQLDTRVSTRMGSSVTDSDNQQADKDYNTKRAVKEDNPSKKDNSFWDLYKDWAEKRCLTKFDILERHVNQLFIRGDNVVSVSVAE